MTYLLIFYIGFLARLVCMALLAAAGRADEDAERIDKPDALRSACPCGRRECVVDGERLVESAR